MHLISGSTANVTSTPVVNGATGTDALVSNSNLAGSGGGACGGNGGSGGSGTSGINTAAQADSAGYLPRTVVPAPENILR